MRQPLRQPSFQLRPRIPLKRREPPMARNWYWSPSPSLPRRTLRAKVQLKQQCPSYLPKLQQKPTFLPPRPNRTLVISSCFLLHVFSLLFIIVFFFFVTCISFAFPRLYLMNSTKLLYILNMFTLDQRLFHHCL